MTDEEKKIKILAASQGKLGFPDGIYYEQVEQLKKEDLIEMRFIYTATGNRTPRWFKK